MDKYKWKLAEWDWGWKNGNEDTYIYENEERDWGLYMHTMYTSGMWVQVYNVHKLYVLSLLWNAGMRELEIMENWNP